jgi:hypothetical protein
MRHYVFMFMSDCEANDEALCNMHVDKRLLGISLYNNKEEATEYSKR